MILTLRDNNENLNSLNKGMSWLWHGDLSWPFFYMTTEQMKIYQCNVVFGIKKKKKRTIIWNIETLICSLFRSFITRDFKRQKHIQDRCVYVLFECMLVHILLSWFSFISWCKATTWRVSFIRLSSRKYSLALNGCSFVMNCFSC